MQPGWKTYWRYPGDSGVPPVFDFAASDNVKSVTVLWPAPVRFADGGGNSIGYKGGVIFPLRVVPLEPGKPVTLRLNLDYAVCETLCVPAKGKAELELTDATGSQEAALKSAEARVPKPVALGRGLFADTAQGLARCELRQAAGVRRHCRSCRDRRRPVRRRADARMGAAAAGAGRRRAPPAQGALPSISTVCRPARRRRAPPSGSPRPPAQEAIEAVFRLD